ncbi:TonB-dependent receptor [Salegentibacter sp.]|uniref:TonB-dependent receptor n=1 Tax=Salegentibacter sp. TaxID=1903072 RepID=UPI003564D902
MKHFTLLFAIILTGYTGFAQQEEASLQGTITDDSGNAIPFVNILIEKTSTGTTSDIDGRYHLEGISTGTQIIKFSAIGYETLSREVVFNNGSNQNLNITLTEDQQDLGEIVITSNRTRETLDEVPSSVSILTAKEIERLNQTSTSVGGLLNEIPGISLSTNQTSNTGQTLRGRNMLVLIDGIPQSTPLRTGGRDINTIDPNTIERIEVIKGATAIYGNGADGGIINYITKSPGTSGLKSTTELSTQGSLVNTEHTLGSKLSQTFSGSTEKLGYVFSGNFQQTGIFRDAQGEVISPTYGLGETNQYGLFGKLNYALAEDHSVEVMYNYFSSNQDTEYVNQNGVYGERPAIGVIGEVLGVDQGNRFNHNAQLTYDATDLIGNTDLKLNLYMQDFKTVYGFSDYFYNAEEGFEGGQSTVESTKKGLRLNFKTPYDLGDEVYGDLLYGVDVLNDKTSQKLMDGRIWAPEMDMTNLAPYAQLKTIYRDFVLKAGLRFENINIDVPDYSTIYIFPFAGETPNGGVAVDGGELSYDATTFNAGLRYNGIREFKPFVSFSQSFSIADLGRTLRTATENTVGQISSEAVIANNYEIGFNSNLGATTLSGAYFISTSDLGATYREVDGIFQIARQPEKVYGFEFSFDTRLAHGLNLGSSVSWTEGKLDSGDNGDYNTYMNGDRIPPLKTLTYISYDLSERWNTRLSHLYSGTRDHFSPDANGNYIYGKGPVESFNVVNLNSSYRLTENTSLSLGIENLLNEDYYNLISQWSARDSNYIKANGARFNLSLKVEI